MSLSSDRENVEGVVSMDLEGIKTLNQYYYHLINPSGFVCAGVHLRRRTQAFGRVLVRISLKETGSAIKSVSRSLRRAFLRVVNLSNARSMPMRPRIVEVRFACLYIVSGRLGLT